MKPNAENPWLKINSEEYEGHMSSPGVGQQQMLNKIFADVINKSSYQSIAVLGCSTGNGLEHLTKKNAKSEDKFVRR